MILRPCLGPRPGMPCQSNLLTSRERCPECARLAEQLRVARRGDRYGRQHRQAAKEAIEEEPWCHWPGCMRVDDLTADHTPDGYQVLCRAHNSEKANRARARK